jgi:hypothetical protein
VPSTPLRQRITLQVRNIHREDLVCTLDTEGLRLRSAVRAVLWRFVTSATRVVVVGSCLTLGKRGEGADRSSSSKPLLQHISWYGRYLALHYA